MRSEPSARAPVDPDWRERWREFHRPVRVGRLWIGPPWEQAPERAVAVVIEPGLAFGTGAHATTRLCLELLVEVPAGSLVDVGCGSGVLAIAAAKLGFGPVTGLDFDSAAVDAARANAKRNSVGIGFRRADALSDPVPESDVVVANLTFDTVVALAPNLSSRWLIASGYLASDDPAPRGFERRRRRVEEGWAADVFERAS